MPNKTTSRRGGKMVLIVLAVLLAAAAAALVIVPRMIPWEKLKDQAQQKLSARLHHEVRIASIKFNLLKGVELKGLNIANAQGFSSAPLLSDKAAVLKYRLWPLLLGKVVVKAVELQQPQLLIEKNRDGRFNFSDMLSTSKEPAASAKAAPAGGPTLKQLPLDILVSHFGIVDAVLTYRDLGTGQEYQLKAFNIKVNNLTLAGLTPIDVLVTTKAKAMGLVIPLAFKTVVRINYAQQKLLLDKVTWNLPGVKGEAHGKVDQILQAPSLDLKAGMSLDLKALWEQMVPPSMKAKLPPVTVTGTIVTKSQLQGRVKMPGTMTFSSDVSLEQLGVALKDKKLLSQAHGHLTLSPRRVTLKPFQAVLGEAPVTFTLNAQGFDLRKPQTLNPKNMVARVDWTLSSDQLDLDALLALMPVKTGAGPKAVKLLKAKAPVRPEPDARRLVPPGLAMTGQAQLKGMIFGKVKLGALQVTTNLKSRRVAVAATLDGYSGQVRSNTSLVFNQPLFQFTTKAEVDHVDLEPLISDTLETFVAAKLKKPALINELKGKMSGRLDGHMSISSQGLQAQSIKKNMTGNGEFRLSNGRLKKFGFQTQLAQWVGNDKFNQDLAFDRILITYTMAKEMVKVDPFLAESGPQGLSGDMRITGQGPIAFDASFKDFKLMPRINPRAAKNISSQFRQYTEVLKDEHEWVALPMVLNGPVKKPDVQPDWTWIKGRVSRYAKQKAGRAAEAVKQKASSFIEKQKGKSADEIKKNVQKELKSLNFNNLFK